MRRNFLKEGGGGWFFEFSGRPIWFSELSEKTIRTLFVKNFPRRNISISQLKWLILKNTALHTAVIFRYKNNPVKIKYKFMGLIDDF